MTSDIFFRLLCVCSCLVYLPLPFVHFSDWFLELNLWFEVFNIFVCPWNKQISLFLLNCTGSDGAMFRQVKTLQQYAQCTAHTHRTPNNTEENMKRWMSHPLLNRNNEWTWIFEKLKIVLPSLTGYHAYPCPSTLFLSLSIQMFRSFLSHTKDWTGFGKQRTQSLDYKTNTNPFSGCQNSIEFYILLTERKRCLKGNRCKRFYH